MATEPIVLKCKFLVIGNRCKSWLPGRENEPIPASQWGIWYQKDGLMVGTPTPIEGTDLEALQHHFAVAYVPSDLTKVPNRLKRMHALMARVENLPGRTVTYIPFSWIEEQVKARRAMWIKGEELNKRDFERAVAEIDKSIGKDEIEEILADFDPIEINLALGPVKVESRQERKERELEEIKVRFLDGDDADF